MFPLFAARVATAHFFRTETASETFLSPSHRRNPGPSFRLPSLSVVKREGATASETPLKAKSSSTHAEDFGETIHRYVGRLMTTLQNGESRTIVTHRGKRTVTMVRQDHVLELSISLCKEPHIRRAMIIADSTAGSLSAQNEIESAYVTNEKSGAKLQLQRDDRAFQLVEFEILSSLKAAVG